MTSSQIRQAFLDFFQSKGHTIVPSAPIVVKNDPTLMFTNAGMNQFKDYFLGNKKAENPRVADTQKCLRVSGKHNDLEEVGVDTYHHTMFEMLGNWSFGDYFKKEAIQWSWELLTEVYKLDKNKLYVTIFEGDQKEGLPKDEEAYNEWKKYIAEDRILPGNKKDNFWEMGDTGPCGPCTEIHYDTRPEANNNAHSLVNNDDTGMVMEIWNNVFIQFNRKKDGSLEPLPAKHVDTGMGLERLVRVIQGKQSNYDTDVFTGTINEIEKITGKKYDPNVPDRRAGSTYNERMEWHEAVSFRVIADHIRAICFAIADGQTLSSEGAGYVIRKILRRAVFYYYAHLKYEKPLLFHLVPIIARQFETVFPELYSQINYVGEVVKKEEETFLRTISNGIGLFEKYVYGEEETEKRIQKFLKENSITTLLEYNLNRTSRERLDIYIPDFKIGVELFKNLKDRNTGEISDRLNKYKQIFSCDVFAEDLSTFTDPFLGKLSLSKILNQNLEGEISTQIDGKTAFELYDTFGFPIDLTRLMASQIRWSVDEIEFDIEMQKQKERSRNAAKGYSGTSGFSGTSGYGIPQVAEDQSHYSTREEFTGPKFIGYDFTEAEIKIIDHITSAKKDRQIFLAVFDQTPFYPQGGGQVGDMGIIKNNSETIKVLNTYKENDLIIHELEYFPKDIKSTFHAEIDLKRRLEIARHHSATHLLHAALRKVLGNHVAQKGSLVNEEYLRFDFSHFAKVTDEEMAKVEAIVNEEIRKNIPVVIKQMKKDEAVALGAMALFGEKYGDIVRVVIIDPNYSVELCGGTHVGATGELGLFKLTSESAVAAGVRRVEAVCGKQAEDYVNQHFTLLNSLKESLKNPKDIQKAIENLQTENAELKKHVDSMEARQLVGIRNELLQKDEIINGVNFIGDIVEVTNADALKKLCFDLKNHLRDHVAVLCVNIDGKPFVAVGISETVTVAKNLDAGKIIKEIVAPLIKGGGGGQKTLATAGGQDASNLKEVIEAVKKLLGN